jgi:hypothetical protein
MKYLSAILSALVLSGCGNLKSGLYNPTNEVQSFNSKASYDSLQVSEQKVDYYLQGNLLMGVGVYEKSQNETICQKTVPVVANPTPSYKCFKQISLTSAGAEATYDGFSTSEYLLQFSIDGQYVMGVSTSEKTSADAHTLCRKTASVSPGAEATFKCYSLQ